MSGLDKLSIPPRAAVSHVRSKAGTTLVEVLVAMSVFLITMAMVGACFVSSLRLFGDEDLKMRAEESGSVFVSNLRANLRGATAVEVSNAGKTIALRCANGDDIAYVFDSRDSVLRQYTRRMDASHPASSRPFAGGLCVKSCLFAKRNGWVSLQITLADVDRRTSTKARDSLTLCSRVRLRAVAGSL